MDKNEFGRKCEKTGTAGDFIKKVLTLSPEDNLLDALRLMHRYFYSQIPVYRGKVFTGLLTEGRILGWITENQLDGKIDLSRVRIHEVLAFGEEKENYGFLKEEASLFEILDLFNRFEKEGKVLESVLITKNGTQNEQVIGIITVWDLFLLKEPLCV
ncbi:MAG: hypothetical protein A2Y41_09835 [Spirochaetes bacterium GWB1_36_13]|nr:MAG: hypothetical protein A2Y41_09835 [Spirochaetes bacterium GWB1_36_13]